jgi:hypothetical protein
MFYTGMKLSLSHYEYLKIRYSGETRGTNVAKPGASKFALLTNYCNDRVKDEMGGGCNMLKRNEKCTQNLSEKEPLRRSRSRRRGSIKMDLSKTEY